jgi:hypothetical protein
LAWSDCSPDFTPLQATMNTITTASNSGLNNCPIRQEKRRKTTGGLIIPKGNGNPWRKVWETRI